MFKPPDGSEPLPEFNDELESASKRLPTAQDADKAKSDYEREAVFQRRGAISDTIAQGLNQLPDDEDEPEFYRPNTPNAHVFETQPQQTKVNQTLLFPWLNNMDPYYDLKPAPISSGFRLNKMDAQLATSHLEQYLPTPSTRYQLMKDRMQKELKSIYQDLERYGKMSGPEYKSKVQGLHDRASLLRKNLIEIDQQLHGINPFQGMVNHIDRLQRLLDPKDGGLLRLFSPDILKEAINQATEEMTNLQEIMDSHLHDPMFSSEQLGQLVNQYDKSLKQAEQIAKRIRERKSFRDKINDFIHQKIRQYYGRS